MSPSRIWQTCLLCLSTHLLIQHTTASVGIVGIDDLLHQKDQQVIAPADASSSSSDESPWTHTPYCKKSTSLSTPGKKYCVYTSNNTGPTGISLIASPRMVAEAAPLLDDNPLSNFLTPRQAEELYLGNEPPYKVVEIEGKGMGVVATRRIKRFETVMVDQASVVVDLELEKALDKKANLGLLSRAVKQLRAPGVVLDLSKEHNSGGKKKSSGEDGGEGDEEIEEGRREEDVMLTNSFGSEVAGVKCRALFPLISRINHECNPNTFVLFSRAGISMAVKAYRDIEIGEEISISYVTLGQPFPRRQAALKRWGFTCTCPLCSLPAHEKTASDLRRSLIAQSTEKIVDLWDAHKHTEAITLTEESVEMIQEEGLEHLLADEYALLSKMWLGVGDRERAVEWGRKSWGLLRGMGFLGRDGEVIGEGEDEWDLESFLELVGGGVKEVVTPPEEEVDEEEGQYEL